MSSTRPVLWVVMAVWGLMLPGGAVAGPAPTPSELEYSVKANYLVRFAAFVGWPSRAFGAAETPVMICVAGRDPFNGSLDRAVRGQTAHGRALAVRRPATVEATAGCHILYVGKGGSALIPAAESRAPMLVVTDSDVTAERGMIHFVVSDARVRFHIDLAAASRSGLSISSRLLNLALSVRGG